MFPVYLFIFIVFLNRYVFGLYLTLVRGRKSRRDDRGLRADGHGRGPALQRGRVHLRHDHQPRAARLPDRQADGHRRRRLLHRRQLRVGAARPPRSARTSRVLRNPFNMGKRRASTTRSAQTDAGDHRLGRLRRHRLSDRAPRAGRALRQPRDRRGRRPRPRLEPERELAHPDADHQVLLRPGAPEEPRARRSAR